MTIDPRDIDALVELFDSSEWGELHLKLPEFELFLSTDPQAKAPGAAQIPVQAAGAPALATGNTAALAASDASQVAASSWKVPGGAPSAPPAAATVPNHWVPVKAPNLGTFYRAPKPGAAPFVEIGQAVDADTEICLIEVMKLFTTLKAGVKGVVRQVCVEDAVMVEFGDTLFYIEPA